MAAPSYTTDLQIFNACTSLTGFGELTGMTATDGDGNVDSDLAIYGTVCITESQRKSGIGSIAYTGTEPTWTSGWCYFIWNKFFAPNSLGTTAQGGIRVAIGNTVSAYYGWYVDGSDTYPYGGWKNYAVDPETNSLATQTQGTPNGTWNTLGIGYNLPVNGISKGNSATVDIMRYGRGESRFTDGDLANGYATFAGYALVNDNATTGRFGLIQEVGGSYLWKGLMSLGLTATSVDFRDSNVVINIDDTEFVAIDFNRIEVHNASSNVDWTSVIISSLGTRSRGQFEMIDNSSVTQSNCTFTDMDTFVYQSNATMDGTIWRRCNEVFQGGSTISSCNFDSTTGVSALSGSNPTLVTNTSFTSDGSSHAYEIDTTGEYDWTDNIVDGYETANGSTGNEVIYNTSGGAVIINVSGGSGTVSYRNGAGATTTINNTVPVTLTGLKELTEVRVLAFGTNTELAGIENATAGVSGSREFTFSLSAATSTTIKIHSLSWQHLSIDFDVPSGATDLPVQQVVDRNYLNP